MRSVQPACSEERRQLKPELASWRKLACVYAAHVHSFCASVATVNVYFSVIGRELTSLVNTLPITKKNKHTVVTEAPKKVHVLLSR